MIKVISFEDYMNNMLNHQRCDQAGQLCDTRIWRKERERAKELYSWQYDRSRDGELQSDHRITQRVFEIHVSY